MSSPIRESPRTPPQNPRAKYQKQQAQYTGNGAPAERLLSRLERVRQTGPDRWQARCPAHDDRSPSLTIRELAEGDLLIHCFTGCGAQDIVDAVGLTLVDLYPQRLEYTHRRPSPPRFNPRDVLKTALTEGTIISLGYRAIQQGETLTLKDQGRVELAIQVLNNLIAEVRS